MPDDLPPRTVAEYAADLRLAVLVVWDGLAEALRLDDIAATITRLVSRK